MRSRIVIVGLVAVLLLPLAGCSNIKSALTPGSKVVSQEATVAAVGAPVVGTLTGIPSGVPIWPGAKVLSSGTTKTASGAVSWNATLSTGDPYKDVLNGMGAGLKASGWTVDSQDIGTATAAANLLSLTKGSSQGICSLSENADKTTTIDIIITP
ncbi:MAG: hypothetical protein HGA39_03770 [Coriobacteriia bacterium]|nr:hypothetical protein [Coriobacteriia bacterium]